MKKETKEQNTGFPRYCAGQPAHRKRQKKILRLKQGREIRDFLGDDWIGIHCADLDLVANRLYHYDPEFHYFAQFFLNSWRKTHPKLDLQHALRGYMNVLSGGPKNGWNFDKWDFSRD